MTRNLLGSSIAFAGVVTFSLLNIFIATRYLYANDPQGKEFGSELGLTFSSKQIVRKQQNQFTEKLVQKEEDSIIEGTSSIKTTANDLHSRINENYETSTSQHHIFSGNDDKVKIVAFTDLTYAPVAKWWYQRMSDLSYKTHTLVLIDDAAVQHFTKISQSNETNPSDSNKRKNIYRFEKQIIDEGKRRKNKVRSLWYNRILYCLNQLRAGQSLLLTDVDNIFSRYEPLGQFYDSEYDAYFALEMKYPTYVFKKMGFVLCGGMTFLKSSEATIKVVEKLLNLCDQPDHPKRCDDQVELNNMLVKDMAWNSTWARKESRLVDGMVQFGFEGQSRAIPGFRAKVWDRDFAWRGSFDTSITCPSRDNWVAMPHTLPHYVWKDLSQFYSKIKGDILVEKLARVHVWENFCGKNGTHRIDPVNRISPNDPNWGEDTMKVAMDIYKSTLR